MNERSELERIRDIFAHIREILERDGDKAEILFNHIQLRKLLTCEPRLIWETTPDTRVRETHGGSIKPNAYEIAARNQGWALKPDGMFERSASDEPERVHLCGDWKALCLFGDIKV